MKNNCRWCLKICPEYIFKTDNIEFWLCNECVTLLQKVLCDGNAMQYEKKVKLPSKNDYKEKI